MPALGGVRRKLALRATTPQSAWSTGPIIARRMRPSWSMISQGSCCTAIQNPTKLGLKANQTINVEDAIKGLVTKSANDAAVVVAEAIGGSEDEVC